MKAVEVPGIGKIQLLDDISSARFKNLSKKAIIILKTIEDYVNMALIQHQRILIDLEQCVKDRMPRIGPHGIIGQPIQAHGKAYPTLLFGDIHYYAICWDKIRKLKEDLDKLLSGVHDVLKTYDALFENYRKIRNSFEHVNDRIEKGIDVIGEFDGTFFTTYDGHRVDLKNGENHLRGFYSNLMDILKKRA